MGGEQSTACSPEAVQDATEANTLANRSPTHVARHIALSRLAMHLAEMEEKGFGGGSGEDLAVLLGIPEEIRTAMKMYSLCSSGTRKEAEDGEKRRDEVEVEEVEMTQAEILTITAARKRARVVSFAKHAELRLFKPEVVPYGRVATKGLPNEAALLQSSRTRRELYKDVLRSKRRTN